MYDHPFLVLPHRNSHRFHKTAARRSTVAGLVVQMDAPQAPGTMVAVAGTSGIRGDTTTTINAVEAIFRRLPVIFNSLMPFFVFTTHVKNLAKAIIKITKNFVVSHPRQIQRVKKINFGNGKIIPGGNG
jgi:hypothetical protein